MNIITINCILIFLISFLILFAILLLLLILKQFCKKREKGNIKVSVEIEKPIQEINEIEFFKAIFRIIKCNSSTHYNISPEDSKLRKELIKKYLFQSENFSKCHKYNPDAKYQGTERCYKNIEESCEQNNIFDDNIKPDSLANIIKLEYLGYLFFIVLHKHLVEKYKDNPDFKGMFNIELALIQDNNSELNYYIKYPMIVFEKHIKDIIKWNSYDFEKLGINLSQINIGFMRKEIEKIEFSCNYGGNYCFSHFRYYYETNFLANSYRLLRKWFKSEKESIEGKLTDTWSI